MQLPTRKSNKTNTINLQTNITNNYQGGNHMNLKKALSAAMIGSLMVVGMTAVAHADPSYRNRC